VIDLEGEFVAVVGDRPLGPRAARVVGQHVDPWIPVEQRPAQRLIDLDSGWVLPSSRRASAGIVQRTRQLISYAHG
jgi:hypothetical protein